MDEQEFDSLMPARPFGTEDAMRPETQIRRNMTLGIALWGRTSADLERQLLAPHPEIPSGCDLADLRELRHSAQMISTGLNDPRNTWLSRSSLFSGTTILVGTQSLTAWEARCEIARPAIDYLEGR